MSWLEELPANDLPPGYGPEDAAQWVMEQLRSLDIDDRARRYRKPSSAINDLRLSYPTSYFNYWCEQVGEREWQRFLRILPDTYSLFDQ